MGQATPERLTIEHVTIDPRTVELLTVNARFMTHDQFKRLVDNIKRDGALTSSPLLYWPPSRERPLCLSGNHRTKASIAADLETIDALVVRDELTPDQQKAMQLAHNAVEGQDDPSTLRALFESIEDMDERLYTGLDDSGLDLLIDVELPSIGELVPRWHSLTFLLLDDEQTDMADVFDLALDTVGPADDYWLARLAQWDDLLMYLQTVAGATKITNRSVGLQVICDVFRRHVTDVGQSFDLGDHHSNVVPLAALVGYDVPTDAAHRLERALTVAQHNGAADATAALDMIVSDWLAGVDS